MRRFNSLNRLLIQNCKERTVKMSRKSLKRFKFLYASKPVQTMKTLGRFLSTPFFVLIVLAESP